ncbi:hypothetical protein HPP92_004035 [Vanilla planifolia]|uniref:Uncharacterized protein n=1 Tax=Vanilla planifolia TaxID=51239 RepID=A0A835VG24_VANPL|nr:hypothetical protein HPP92_004035 [Vanilla planifolia]
MAFQTPELFLGFASPINPKERENTTWKWEENKVRRTSRRRFVIEKRREKERQAAQKRHDPNR